ncbi:DNA-binding SARP family transcriptional activator [Kitasatospora herbaricolor]|uniref:AfsR/SARP family transcriptional regulator n=1 Tax=Kitasatospora herbaricolor TaxID=68217 RepID=UPI001E43B98C|nr:BTAD domain-containing putative transcriptional regulator [Kitasatospora herbaricolor]MDQ0313302.1 DNA-binding SARP family transcriptional activator [Kitasatospora herbaricolor]
MTIGFAVLGEIRAVRDGACLDLGPARQRTVLAALLTDLNRTVPPDRLADRVWGARAPQRAAPTLYTYLSRLRRVLDTPVPVVAPAPLGTSDPLGTSAALGRADLPAADRTDREPLRRPSMIARRAGGYALLADAEAVDVQAFHDLVARARSADGDRAAALFDRALGLWRGEPFAGVDTPWFNSARETLNEQRHACRLDRNDLHLRRGRHAVLLTELAACHRRHPLDERLTAQLLLALYRSGRIAEALRSYEQVRTALAEELGSDPGPELRRLHGQILAADPAIDPPGPSGETATLTAPGTPPAPGTPSTAVEPPEAAAVPRQLPCAPRWFTGRRAELGVLERTLGHPAQSGGAPAICAVTGSGGIGKTSLALHWAHRNAGRFPDGQLYVDLRGFGPVGEPLAPAAAVRILLDALGVDPAARPADPQALTGLYRDLLADRRLLIVLDNAADAGQVTALLPGTAGPAVLVTSRRRLTGLAVTHGAHLLPLDVFTPSESLDLLRHHLGADRVAADPAAAHAVLDHCAGLPLAVAVAGARTAARAGHPLAALAEELRDESARLDALDAGGPGADVRAACRASYRALTEGAAEAFRYLGAAPGPEIGLPAAASLLARSPAATRAALRELESLHLLQEHAPGRYRMNALTRLYAREHRQDESGERALRRVLDFYLHTAHAGDRILRPHPRRCADLRPPLDGVTPQPLADRRAARSWFRVERSCLLAARRLAEQQRADTPARQLARALDGFLRNQESVLGPGAVAAGADQDELRGPKALRSGALGCPVGEPVRSTARRVTHPGRTAERPTPARVRVCLS